MNPGECYNNLNPECECDVSRGYFGSDPKLCKLSDNHCSSTGFELALNGKKHNFIKILNVSFI